MYSLNLSKNKVSKYVKFCLRSLLIWLIVALSFAQIPIPSAWAANVSWVGGTDTNWSTAANWSTGVVPTSSDDVLINANVTVNLSSATTIKSLTLGNSSGTTTPTLNFAYDAITVGALTIDGGNLQTYTGSVITHTVANLGSIVGRIKIVLTTGDINIQGSVNVNNKGYAGGPTNGANGYGTGGGIGWYSQYGTGGAGGAGHGSPGQAGANSAGGIRYQTLRIPTDLGSGGGRGYSYSYGTGAAGSGGGNVYIYSEGDVTIAGTVSANGQAGAKYSGGGSGGSIYIHGNNVTISGTVSSGGGALSTSSGAGSGGRIVIEHAGTISVSGTISTSTTAVIGTAYFQNVTTNDLTIPIANTTWYSGDLDSWSFGDINVNANVTLKPSTTSTFQISASDDLTLASGVTLSTAGYYTTDSDGVGLFFDIGGDVTIPSTSKISGNALGYRGGYSVAVPTGTGTGKGIGLANHSYGDVPASGAGHGGAGGTVSSRSGGSAYGIANNPVTLGSGGGFGNSYLNPSGIGGNGGSAIKLQVDGTTQIDGTLSANGGDATTIAGGGAGGSINLTTGVLAGSGTISATGGTGVVTAYGTGGNGGGGRIALNYNSTSWAGNSLLASVATAKGVNGLSGADGTVYIPPIYQNISTTNITKDSATLTGDITNIDILGATDHGFTWDDNAELSSPTQVSKGASSSNGAITTDLSGLSPVTTYYYKLYATVAGVTTYSTIQSFETLVDNVAPTAQANEITGDNIYADKSTDIISIYSDSDGLADLNKLYLQIKNPSDTDIEYYINSGTTNQTDQSPTAVSGSEYITAITYDTVVNSPDTNDISVTWHITPDWDWTNSTTLQYGVKASDDPGLSSTYDYTTTTYTYENRLAFAGTLQALDSESSTITESDWTSANQSISFTGIKVVYNGTQNIYPTDSVFDVKLTNDESDEWFVYVSSGQDINIEATTANNTNTNDSYIFSIINIPKGITESDTESFTVQTDKTVPVISSLTSSTHPDSLTWYTAQSANISWNIYDNQSGIYKVWRLVDKVETQTNTYVMYYGTEVSSVSSYTTTLTTDGSWYVHMVTMDNVGLENFSTFKINVDLQNPSIVSAISSSHPNQNTWYSNKLAALSWTTTDSGSGVQGVWRLINQNSTITTTEILTNGTQALANATWTTSELSNGIWYIHLLAKDNTAKTTYLRYTLHIDSSTPSIVGVTGSNNNVWQNVDSGPVISWTDPVSISDDTFYITNDGTIPTSTNYTYTTTASSYDLPAQKEGETTIKVRALNGAGTYSDTKTFTIKYDTTAPANVSSLSANPSTSSVTLTWQNPTSSDFSKVIIIRDSQNVPTSITDGTNIYEGNLASYTDTNVVENTRYYYTVFAFDRTGNQSSGTITQITTSTTSTSQPYVPPITEQTKVVTVQDLTEEQTVSITADQQQTTTSDSGDIHVYTQQTIDITIPAATITSNTSDLKDVIFVVANDSYLMTYDAQTDTYKTTINAPTIKGTYDTKIQTISNENISDLAITMSLMVDPYGYVYSKAWNNEVRITNASVSLYKKVNDVATLWSSSNGSTNPQITNSQGEYSFFVEPGEYKIVVEAQGYTTVETDWFTVEANIIERNIELTRNPYIYLGFAFAVGIITSIGIIVLVKRRNHAKPI